MCIICSSFLYTQNFVLIWLLLMCMLFMVSVSFSSYGRRAAPKNGVQCRFLWHCRRSRSTSSHFFGNYIAAYSNRAGLLQTAAPNYTLRPPYAYQWTKFVSNYTPWFMRHYSTYEEKKRQYKGMESVFSVRSERTSLCKVWDFCPWFVYIFGPERH